MYSKSSSALSLSYNTNNINNNKVIKNQDSIELPDLSHLSEAERHIIQSVLERQRVEECNSIKSDTTSTTTTTTTINKNALIRDLETSEFDIVNTIVKTSHSNSPIKYSTLPHAATTHIKQDKQQQQQQNQQKKILHQCHSISDIANETKQRYGSIDTGNLCDVCKKTKFTYSGAGNICFYCKLRCCVRCAFKYTTKNKQIWTCSECKKKQDILLKSNKWFNNENSNLPNRKSYTSDYILNKAVTLTTNKTEMITTTTTNMIDSSSSNTTNTAIKTTSRRILPTITKQHSIQLKDKQEEEEEEESNKSAQLIEQNRSSINSITKLRQPLIKQTSLTSQPTYTLYSNQDNNFSNNLTNKLFTSKQDLIKTNLNLSSPNSSNTQLNNRTRERLQDPLLLLKSINDNNKKSNPNSRLNSMTNIACIDENKTDMDLFSTEKKLQQPQIQRGEEEKKQQPQKLLHADSLSSDPSDYQQTSSQIEYKTNNSEDILRKQTSQKLKRNARARKQPVIPIITNQQQQQILLHKALLKHNLKQHSLTSSDDDMVNILNKSPRFFALDPEEEEEVDDNFNDDDIDEEEVRSTTEISTNDEMDLESGSVSIQNNKMKKNLKNIIPVTNSNQNNNNNKNNDTNIRLDSNIEDQSSKTIDDYLVQNLKKEEILAAKMSKFLLPTNWQLASDGKKLIGNLILKHDPNLVKSSSTSTFDSITELNSASLIGLKIIGGRPNPLLSNQLCAYVAKVRKNSIADTIGRLQIDDEIVKWNGKLLRGLTYDEVYSLISNYQLGGGGGDVNEDSQNNQIELIVERLIDDSDRIKFKSLLWNESNMGNADLKKVNEQQEQLVNCITSNKPIGIVQLKIFHDSIERILYINVLNISIKNNNNNYNEQTNIETATKTRNDSLLNNINNTYNNNNNNKNEAESIYCILHLLLKKRNIYQFKKLSEVCNLDKTTGLFLINEAFTFEPVNSIDLPQLNFELQAINYLTKEPLGKINIEYSKEMFDNQLLNLNMLPINSNNQANLNKNLPQHGQTTLVDNNNNNNQNNIQNSRRRQLPLPPGMTSKQSDNNNTAPVDLTEKTRRIKLELRPDKSTDSELMMISNNNNQFKTISSVNEQPSSLVANQQKAQFNKINNNNNNNNLIKQYSDKSDYSNENEEHLFNNNNTFQPQQQIKKQQPVVPPHRSRLRDTSQLNPNLSLSNNNSNNDQFLYGQQETAQTNITTNTTTTTNNRRNLFVNNNNNSQDIYDNRINNNSNNFNNGDTNKNIISSEPKHLNHSLRRQETPPSPIMPMSSPPPSSNFSQSSAITKPSVQSKRQLPQPVKPANQNFQNNNNNNSNTSSSFLPQGWPEKTLDNTTTTTNNNLNRIIKKPDRLIDLNNKTSDLYASNKVNNSSYLSQSPDDNNNNKFLNRNSIIKSPFKQQSSLDYSNEYSKPNPQDTQQQQQQFPNNNNNNNPQGTTSTRRAEKLFSARHLNQRILGNNNLNTPNSGNTFQNNNINNNTARNGFEFDSDGSEHSQFSNVSKLSSTSVKSAQSELLKGANNNNNNNNNNNSNYNSNNNSRKINKLVNNDLNNSRKINQTNYQDYSNNYNEFNNNQINNNNNNNEWKTQMNQNEPLLAAASFPPSHQQQEIKTISPPPPSSQQQATSSSLPAAAAAAETPQTSKIKQSKNEPNATSNTNNTTTGTTETTTLTSPTASTNVAVKSTSNITIPSYIKSKDNPTFDFFVQFSTPVKQTSKNNSTISLPGQSMQLNTTINSVSGVKETDGTLSDSALSNPNNPPENNTGANKKRRPSMAKALVILGLSKKSSSASNLTLGKRYGFARSEEIGAVPELRNLKLNNSSAGAAVDNSGGDMNHPKPRLWSGALKLPHEVPYSDFIDGLGPGQKISRQALSLPCLGEVKMSLFLEKQKLNIEIMQAKNLKIKIGYRVMPASVYIKLYLFNGASCVEKQKTTTKRRTLNPTFQETLKFEANYRGTILQITCWGDYGKLDKKVFMGVAQIVLDELNLASTVVGWYKLYSAGSIVNDFSTLTPASDLCSTESGYSLASK